MREAERVFTSRLVSLLAVGAMIGFAAFPPTARAAPLSCGSVVTQSVALDSDLTCGPGDALIAGASNIVIDLKGHTITGPYTHDLNSGAGVRIPWGGPYTGVEIRNGTIRGFGAGVVIDTAYANRVTNLTLANNVRGVEVANANLNTIDKNRIYGSELDAVRMGGVSSGNQVLQNTLAGNVFGIAAADGSGVNLISQNQIASSRDWGISVFGDPTGNVISRNVVSGSRDDGIAVSGSPSDTTLSQNKVTGNGRDGIAILGSTTGTSLQQNVATGNGRDGIAVSESTTETSLTQNTATGNGDDGIDIDSTSATLTKNTASYNFDLGIEAAEGVNDGGGNVAVGNGNPAQCTGVSCSP